MNDLIAITQQWATKQLEYPPSGPYQGKYPRDNAVIALLQTRLVQGLVVSLPTSAAIPLLQHIWQRVEAANASWDDMEALGWWLVEESVERLSQSFASVGDYESALHIAKHIQNDSNRSPKVADLAVMAFKAGNMEQAKSLCADAWTLTAQLENEWYRIGAYSELIPRLVQLEDIKGALDAALLVTSQGTIERERFHDFIRYLCDQKRFDEAEQVARLFRSPTEKGIALCEISTALIDIRKIQSDALMREAEEMALSQTTVDAQIYLFSALLVACFLRDDQVRFEHYLKKTSDLVETFELQNYPSPIGDYSAALAKIGRLQEAYSVSMRCVLRATRKEFVYHSILGWDIAIYLIRVGRYEEAYDTAYQLVMPGQPIAPDLHGSIRILTCLLAKLIEDEQEERAQTYVDRLIELVRTTPQGNLRIFVLAITRILVRYQRYDALFELLDRTGIDEFAQAIASAAEYFEVAEKGLSLRMLQEIIRIGAQKYDDYAELLPFINVD